MKSFDLKMLDVPKGHIETSLAGIGPVSFEVKELDSDDIIEFRRHFIGVVSELGENPDPADANIALFQVAVEIVKNALIPELTTDQAIKLIPMAGGANGDFVRQIAIRCGVSDLLFQSDDDDEGLQDELPM